MARINKSALTKLEIIRVACRLFLSNGYSNTTAKMIANELGMSTGNLTFHYPTKEHLLAELVALMCDFQWHLMEKEADEGYSSIMAVCLEFAVMAAGCEKYAVAKDFYLSSYSNPMTLELIRRNDAKRAKDVFSKYRPDWGEEEFAEAETLVSGIEYATLMTTPDSAPLETRIAGALYNILAIYGIPADMRKMKVERVLSMDYVQLAKRVLDDFKNYVDDSNEQAFNALVAAK